MVVIERGLFFVFFCVRRYPESCMAGMRLKCAMNEFLMIFSVASFAVSFVSFQSLGLVPPCLQNRKLEFKCPKIHRILSILTSIVVGPS